MSTFDYGRWEQEANDEWLARIEREHAALGPACPCGNGRPADPADDPDEEQPE